MQKYFDNRKYLFTFSRLQTLSHASIEIEIVKWVLPAYALNNPHTHTHITVHIFEFLFYNYIHLPSHHVHTR